MVIQHQGIKLNLPAAKSTIKEKKGLIVSVSAKNEIFYDGKPTQMESIRTLVSASLKSTPELQVILNADENTAYQTVIELLDKIRLGGCFDVVLEAEKLQDHET